MNINPQTFDNLAIGLALGAIVLRLIDATWWSGVFGMVSFGCSAVAGALTRRREIKPWS